MLTPSAREPSRKLLLLLLFAASFALRIGYMAVRGTLGVETRAATLVLQLTNAAAARVKT